VPAEDTLPSWEIRLASGAPHPSKKSYSLGVYNPGTRALTNIVAQLEDIVPYPKDPLFQANAAFPYRLKSLHNDQVVNPGTEVLFEIFGWWVAGSDGVLRIGGILPGVGNTPFKIEEDESWRFHITLSAADHAPMEYRLMVHVENGKVVLDQTS